MAGDEIHWAGVRDLGRRFRAKELSPVELTTALLRRIEALDPTLDTFVTVTADRALADAKAAEAALRRGDARPLLGIPVGYKDLYATRGIRTTAGSALLEDWVPDADATCVTRLQDAGCVMLGKLITHEFAWGIQSPGHRFKPARNPWNRGHIPGGSSSGSGAALAAGFCVGALGSDTGGSIRGPASFSGVVGLKPTYGRCSRAGVVTLSWTLDHTGPLTRTVEDCAYFLAALAGHDPLDPASSRAPVADYVGSLGASIRGLRVGVPRDFFLDGADAEVVQAFETALGALRGLGADVRDVVIPSIWDAPSFMVIMASEAFAYHERDLRERPERYGDLLRERLMSGGLYTGAEYVQAMRLRERLRREMLDVLGTVDLLATPTSPKPAPTFEAMYDVSLGFPRSNMPPFNLSGLPALALPCGFSKQGLPLSLQLAGRPFDEATVLRAGHAYQETTDWHRRRPPVG
ncbi:MAG: Asp-tRNA(Asn)/Glu-tRNA(Gln) amidotransferase subunit GatA [Candidatus Rokubacteria bacterium]|nr:Asp-tRNA(Asn)/Glu-tRNA(Gln) amidotransferase subunit GatA [Candidatus Rokubacteria bacterium]